jgi:hypothetical protein
LIYEPLLHFTPQDTRVTDYSELSDELATPKGYESYWSFARQKQGSFSRCTPSLSMITLQLRTLMIFMSLLALMVPISSSTHTFVFAIIIPGSLVW